MLVSLCLCFGVDTMVCTGCCATLDNIITYLFKKLTRKQSKPANVESDTFLRILELHPDILQQVKTPLEEYVRLLHTVFFCTMFFLYRMLCMSSQTTPLSSARCRSWRPPGNLCHRAVFDDVHHRLLWSTTATRRICGLLPTFLYLRNYLTRSAPVMFLVLLGMLDCIVSYKLIFHSLIFL